jgi:methylmalonyl-CoA/ethylmalonyl-CoA epimerase
VGIAVRNLEESIRFYETVFGLRTVARERHDDQGINEAMLAVSERTGERPAYVQLFEPTRPDSPVGKFLERRGEGIHHVGYGVSDIAAALRGLAAQGIELVDQRPRHGSLGAAIAFLHPKSVGGVLTELVQAAGPAD